MQKQNAKSRRTSGVEGHSARETLLRAGRRLFARKGLGGTTIRDIAAEARMNSSQISYYFDNKEGLYRACIEDIALSRIKPAQAILKLPSSREEFKVRLGLFIEDFFNFFIEDRDTGLIVIREYDRSHSPAEKIFKTYFSELFSLLYAYFETAEKKGFIVRNGDPLITTSLFFGTLMSELRFDHIKESLFKRTIKDRKERSSVIQQIVDLFARSS